MHDDELEARGGRVLIQRTPRGEMCDELRDEAADVVGAIDSLEFGLHELALERGHALYDELAQTRAAMEHVKRLLDADALRENLHEEDDGDPSGGEDQQPDP